MDLGVAADISRFWIALRTHSDLDRFYEFSVNSLYDFELWGTTTDFGENSRDYVPPEDPYWTEELWKRDPRWRYMGRYLNKRWNVQGDSPGNYSSIPPNRNQAAGEPASNRLDWDAAWTASRSIREPGNGYRYLADGSGPVKNNGFYWPDANVHYAITEPGVGAVRYVRWQINETWQQTGSVAFSELWYWGGIASDDN